MASGGPIVLILSPCFVWAYLHLSPVTCHLYLPLVLESLSTWILDTLYLILDFILAAVCPTRGPADIYIYIYMWQTTYTRRRVYIYIYIYIYTAYSIAQVTDILGVHEDCANARLARCVRGACAMPFACARLAWVLRDGEVTQQSLLVGWFLKDV